MSWAHEHGELEVPALLGQHGAKSRDVVRVQLVVKSLEDGQQLELRVQLWLDVRRRRLRV